MIRPTPLGWAVAVLAVTALGAGWWWSYPGVVAIGASFAALVLLSLASIAAPARFEARREVAPLQVPRFGRCTATYEIVHKGRWSPATVTAEEQVDGQVVPIVDAIDVPTSRRGRITLGPLRLRRIGVAGLAERVDLATGVTTVRVLPRVLPLRALPNGSARWVAGSDDRVANGGTDLVGMRDYLPGDDLRRLHWATSARSGRLMVREDADPSQGSITVLLDDREPGYGSPAEFEEAVDTAASIASAACALGNPVALRTASGRVWAERAEVDEVLALLGDASLGGAASAERSGTHDVLVVVGGGGASDITEFASLTVVMEVGAAFSVDVTGPAVVLRGRDAEELLRAWEEHLVPWQDSVN
ncbi:MAG TPA: DUF58 domain-containing protein [Candidatus Limnocylindrales bacterium]